MKNNAEGLMALLPGCSDDDSIYNKIVNEYYDRRVLILNEEITDDLFEYIVLSVVKWNLEDENIPAEKRKRIKLVVQSNGGDAILGDQILSTIETSITPVDTIGFSKALSMGSYILVAGKKRYVFPSTVILLHDGESGYITSSNKGRDIQKFYDELNKRENDFMVNHTKMTPEFLDEIKDREYYMFPEEAKERGLVDYIIGEDCALAEAFE